MEREAKSSVFQDIKLFGFWVYLMTDLIIFSVLFAVFIILRDNTYDGPSGSSLFEMKSALAETLILLCSSFTCALGTYFVHREQKKPALLWYFITFLLGASFLYLELSEFYSFVGQGASWRRSAFLSSFFTLVGTHGFHITVGLLWMAVSMVSLAVRSFSKENISQIFRMAFFWHFLDIVWVFIFTIVYGMGHLLK